MRFIFYVFFLYLQCERMFEENEDEITDLYKNRPEDDIMPDAEREVSYMYIFKKNIKI